MSDKQLTGTITLPGVDPDLYELTGEFRNPKLGEWFMADNGNPMLMPDYRGDWGHRAILRRKPRKIRVTPTQADLDAATEPIPCWWCYDEPQTSYPSAVGVLTAISKFHKPFHISGKGWASQCEIEKEVTE